MNLKTLILKPISPLKPINQPLFTKATDERIPGEQLYRARPLKRIPVEPNYFMNRLKRLYGEGGKGFENGRRLDEALKEEPEKRKRRESVRLRRRIKWGQKKRAKKRNKKRRKEDWRKKGENTYQNHIIGTPKQKKMGYLPNQKKPKKNK